MDSQRLTQASSIVVIRGSGFSPKKRTENERLAVEKDPGEIRALIDLLYDVIPGSDTAWMELPVVSFAFTSEKGLLEEIGLLGGGRWVRHPDVDLQIRDPAALGSWLGTRGVQLS